MGHLSYEESKSKALKIIIILAIMTFSEVIFALLGKGHLIEGFSFPIWIVGAVMIIMSLVKAYLIIYEFMHMKYEVPYLVKTVILPMGLLVWAVVAFFSEGNYWKNSRMGEEQRKKAKIELQKQQGSLIQNVETKQF